MPSDTKAAETVRAPRQERSQRRVDQILEAARSIIAEKGAAGLTISEIAEVAGVTAGSMYQYFPGKAAVIYALAEQSIEQLEGIVSGLLQQKPRSNEAFAAMLTELLEEYYQAFKDDPVIRDIWTGVGSDKTLTDLNLAVTEKMAQQLLSIAIPLAPGRDPAVMERDLRLLMAFGDAATVAVLYLDKDEARPIIDRAKRMILHMWLSPP